MRYKTFSEYLKNKYGEKVYKIPVNLPITCPNRDGNVGCGGCIFCGDVGAAFENLPSDLPVKEQIRQNIDFIGKKYKAEKFIIYFQNFTNTYMSLDEFKRIIMESSHNGVCAVYISTRPDCIRDSYLKFLKEFSECNGYDVCIELGLQSVNYKTLLKINRGHTLAEFIDAVLKIKKYGFDICSHVILNLPWDDNVDVVECAKFISSLGITQVKLHSLYIVKNTPLAKMYENGEFDMGSYFDYVDKAISFIQYLSPDIVIQRLIGRAKEEHTVFCNYGTSWWKIKDNIDSELEIRNIRQGDKFDYLNGKALKKFD
ncbi:MAG: TIGR01212 family radical SAM protein [Clostridia bacterium]|nr:TIGR01212 family radical SAM protein [Clostridia bacterium]